MDMGYNIYGSNNFFHIRMAKCSGYIRFSLNLDKSQFCLLLYMVARVSKVSICIFVTIWYAFHLHDLKELLALPFAYIDACMVGILSLPTSLMLFLLSRALPLYITSSICTNLFSLLTLIPQHNTHIIYLKCFLHGDYMDAKLMNFHSEIYQFQFCI